MLRSILLVIAITVAGCGLDNPENIEVHLEDGTLMAAQAFLNEGEELSQESTVSAAPDNMPQWCDEFIDIDSNCDGYDDETGAELL